ncbi:MAG: zf-HC2 domain-containing protein [Gemmatimonas sp.]
MTIAPIDCRTAMRELWDYLDNELPAERTEQIRAHLATCIGCHEHMEFCRAFLQQIELPTVPAAAVVDLRARVRDALQRDGLTHADSKP